MKPNRALRFLAVATALITTLIVAISIALPAPTHAQNGDKPPSPVRAPIQPEPTPTPHLVPIELESTHLQYWRAAGFSGQGMRIGLIDLGFLNLENVLRSRFPAATFKYSCYTSETSKATSSTPSDCESRPGGDPDGHGQKVTDALLEVIPQATIYVTNPRTDAQFRHAFEWLTANPPDGLTHDDFDTHRDWIK